MRLSWTSSPGRLEMRELTTSINLQVFIYAYSTSSPRSSRVAENRQIYVDVNDPRRSFSANEARTLVRKLISGFKANGLEAGDCVCLHAFNDVLYPIFFLAIVGAGGVFVGMEFLLVTLRPAHNSLGANPGYTTLELAHHIKVSKTKFVVSESDLLSEQFLIEECGILSSRIFELNLGDNHGHQGTKPWEELLRHGESDWTRLNDELSAKSQTAGLFSTSGTTGLPKMAMISHYNIVLDSIAHQNSQKKPYQVRRLLCLPQFHVFCAPMAFIAPLREGAVTYIMPRFNMEKYLGAVRRFEITETMMVPPMMIDYLKSPTQHKNFLKTLEVLWVGGAPLDISVIEGMYQHLAADATIAQVWGMTEVGWITTTKWPEKDVTGSVGRLIPSREAKVLDENENDISATGRPGHILVRSPSVMRGYLGDSRATSASFDTAGWLKTGDIGFCDNGKWYIVDREKEIMKVRGWQVAPTELEAVLLKHPQIVDVAVIGVTPPNSISEAPRAYVVRASEASELKEEEVKSYLAARLAKYKALDGGVEFVPSIPKSNSGKILKKLLRAEYEQKRSEAGAEAELLEVDKQRQNASMNPAKSRMEKGVEYLVNGLILLVAVKLLASCWRRAAS
ncbi:MAG: hypothetical protein M1833_002882 [Piccolia ochrophora]|nr:MAG: hypothetical protein M1833_002882 [Piccolia ochrophora]